MSIFFHLITPSESSQKLAVTGVCMWLLATNYIRVYNLLINQLYTYDQSIKQTAYYVKYGDFKSNF